MLKLLLKKQLYEIFRSYFYDAKKNRARSKASVAAYIVFFVVIMVGLLGGMFTFLAGTMCRPLAEAGMSWLYFAIMGLIAVALGAFGSVFNTYSGLYLAKDNDLLLSMPIPVGAVIASRLLGVYLMGLMYSAVVIVPAVIVYWLSAAADFMSVLGGVLMIVLISVFVMTLSCALGWVVARISLRLKNKSFITVIISLLFIGAYYFFYYKAQSVISDIVLNAAEYGARIRGSAYPVYLFGSVGAGDGKAMLIVAAAVLALFALVWLLLSRSFLNIATASSHTEKRTYRRDEVRLRSAGSALFGKELSRFVSSPNYMLNCGLGILLLPVCGVLLLIKGGDFLPVMEAVFAERGGAVPALLCAGVCIVAAMNDMAAPSVSLEGKSLWVVLSLPVTPWQVLRAKLRLQMVLTGVPALFCAVCAVIAGARTAAQAAFIIIMPLLFAAFSSYLGLFFGLKLPNLSWTNEISPIKQSLGVMLALLGGFIYAALLGGVYLAAGYRLGFTAYMLLFAVLTLAASAALRAWIKRQGSAVFAEL